MLARAHQFPPMRYLTAMLCWPHLSLALRQPLRRVARLAASPVDSARPRRLVARGAEADRSLLERSWLAPAVFEDSEAYQEIMGAAAAAATLGYAGSCVAVC
mmetsp:Transcript_8372/g.26249  ORF Transcript_8372/g.26249 Transcript_8372/m.26249 type:complete len:102 (+) Transcript_8372:76-381(+)